jgi:lipoate-protein ligase A
MRFINDFYSNDAYFNLAAEEYLLNNSDENICRIWQNEKAVVIGKHQALPVEVNTKSALENNVQIARRISGGGTVYHDLGNINFTFIVKNKDGKNWIDFDQFTIPVLTVIQKLGVPIVKNERNDLLIDAKKVSGNAEHLSQKLGKTIHHGTLLFNSDLSNLGNTLKTPFKQFEGKFVQSKRSMVCNIQDYVPKKMSHAAFRESLVNGLITSLDAKPRNWSISEIDQIQTLAKEKYSTREWIYGYSPKFKFKTLIEGKSTELSIVKGRIASVESRLSYVSDLREALNGKFFDYHEVSRALHLSVLPKEKIEATMHGFFTFTM